MTASQRIPYIPLIISLFSMLFFIVSSFTISAIASPYIVGDLGGDRSITFYSLSFFGFGAAISIPLAKPLAAQFGPKQDFRLLHRPFFVRQSFMRNGLYLFPIYLRPFSYRHCLGSVLSPFGPLFFLFDSLR